MALSKKTKEAFLGPLNINNPVLVQILGICSALAVTVQLKPALVMGISVTIIVAMSNVVVSLIRNSIPTRIRIIIQLVVVAALVTIVSDVLKALRRGDAVERLSRSDHYELYPHGSFGGIRHVEQRA